MDEKILNASTFEELDALDAELSTQIQALSIERRRIVNDAKLLNAYRDLLQKKVSMMRMDLGLDEANTIIKPRSVVINTEYGKAGA